MLHSSLNRKDYQKDVSRVGALFRWDLSEMMVVELRNDISHNHLPLANLTLEEWEDNHLINKCVYYSFSFVFQYFNISRKTAHTLVCC